MPIYEYECRKCKAHLEVLQKMNDEPPAKCPKCGGRLDRKLSAPAIQFKGSGWYVTDYAGAGRKESDKSEQASGSTDKGGSESENSTKKPDKSKENSSGKKGSEKSGATK